MPLPRRSPALGRNRVEEHGQSAEPEPNLVLAAKPLQLHGPNKKTHKRRNYCTIERKRHGPSRRFVEKCSTADCTEGLLRSKGVPDLPKKRRGHVSPGVERVPSSPCDRCLLPEL